MDGIASEPRAHTVEMVTRQATVSSMAGRIQQLDAQNVQAEKTKTTNPLLEKEKYE